MSQNESWHWTHEPVPRKLKGMTATQIRPASRLSPLVATWCVLGVTRGVEHEELFDADLRASRRHPSRAQHRR
jgi:hypothetical protein